MRDDIVGNCPLCEKRGLHVISEGSDTIQQCLTCGYVSSKKYIGTKEDNEEYKKLSDDMKEWAIENNGRIWIPSMLTLPFAMYYPNNNKDGKMVWEFAKMVDIPEDDQKNYPKEDSSGFHTKRYDTEDTEVFENFIEGMSMITVIAMGKEHPPQGI